MSFGGRGRVRWAVCAVLAALWATSLGLAAIRIDGGPELDGLEVLLQGWRGATVGVYAWYANPLFLGALLAAVVRQPLAAGIASGAGLVLALTSFAASNLAQSTGGEAPELALGGGFYVWLLPQVVLCAWCWAAVWGRLLVGNARKSESSDEIGIDRHAGPP